MILLFFSYGISGEDIYFIRKTHAYMYDFVRVTEKKYKYYC
jgi:hypothetical protein